MSYPGKYYAKILMFGEYSVIYDSMGLTIPFDVYSGSFGFCGKENDVEELQSNKNLSAFHDYLQEIDSTGELVPDIDLLSFGKAIKEGLFFNSDIPQGFGIGSSGAVCAAVYDHFCNHKTILNSDNWDTDIRKLKQQFAQMESYFHGISSGLDPLISYLHEPLHIVGKDNIRPAEKANPVDLDIFLVNTGTKGKTGPLVNLFFDMLRKHSFYKKFNTGFMVSNDNCIQNYLGGETENLYENLTQLSAFTLELFDPMIPEGFKGFWKEGLDNGDYLLKLCGSGGGGFLLGFTREYGRVQKKLSHSGIDIIPLRKAG
jgi:mevalonate kinase